MTDTITDAVELTTQETLDWCGSAFRNASIDGVFDKYDLQDIRDALNSTRKAAVQSQLAERDAEIEGLLDFLRGIRGLAIKAHSHWDADEDMKAGKIVMALAGMVPGYTELTDKIDSLLSQEKA